MEGASNDFLKVGSWEATCLSPLDSCLCLVTEELLGGGVATLTFQAELTGNGALSLHRQPDYVQDLKSEGNWGVLGRRLEFMDVHTGSNISKSKPRIHIRFEKVKD
jgi:hypothetical protein